MSGEYEKGTDKGSTVASLVPSTRKESDPGSAVESPGELAEDAPKNILQLNKTDETPKKPAGITCQQIVWDNLLIIFIFLAVIIGVSLGVGLRSVWSHEDYRKIFYLEFPGRILLNMLKLLILPLIVSSLVTGMASLGAQASGKLGGAAVLYYMTTTFLSVILGIVMVLSIHPGSAAEKSTLKRVGKSSDARPLESLLDLISQCFPRNLILACFERVVTKIVEVDSDLRYNETDGSNYTVKLEKPVSVSKGGTNVLGLVVFSIALGCVISHLGEAGRPLLYFFDSLNSATLVLINLVIWYTPVGIIFLVAAKFVATDDIVAVLEDLGMYSVTVLSGLFIHGVIVLPTIFFVMTRKNPAFFAFNMLKALSTAWGTASSSATLPVTMDCLVNLNKVNLNIVRFVAPVGATINMDGTALYEAVACIFIAQVNGKELSMADVIVISLTATAAAIGAAGVPQAGLVTLVIVLTAVGLPTDDVTLILSIDWFLDRFRTTLNVWGDSVGAGILDHLFKGRFDMPPGEKTESDVTKNGRQVTFADDVNINSFITHSESDDRTLTGQQWRLQ